MKTIEVYGTIEIDDDKAIEDVLAEIDHPIDCGMGYCLELHVLEEPTPKPFGISATGGFGILQSITKEREA
jgi:hypothetical protein